MAKEGDAGAGVDAQGRPVRDPTENVLEILRTAVQRQDDLRKASEDHTCEVIALRGQFNDELRRSEASRLDAIRAVDVGAVNRAAEVAATQAQALATQVSVSAETLRNQVAAAAQAQTVALAAALEPIQKDVQDLRRIQYEQQGSRVAVAETKDDRRSGASVIYGFVGAFVGVIGVGSAIAIAVSK